MLGVLIGCNGGEVAPLQPDLRIDEAWARPVAVSSAADTAGPHGGHGSGSNGAVYLTIRNAGREADRLISIETPTAHLAELHESRVEDGIARMRQVEGLTIGAGETVELRPGGYHIMLIHLNIPLEIGNRFPMSLHFEKEGVREVEVEVRAH